MKFAARLQLLTCLMVYASSAHAIMVKYGTKEGPIEPPSPEPSPSPQPYRDPAPVWEERTNDTPDPNAQWRPFFLPHPKNTNIIMQNPVSTPLQAVNNAQRFVNAYIPQNKPVRAANAAFLSSQNLPGVGLRYFYPSYQDLKKTGKQEDNKLNHINADLTVGQDSGNDFQWKYEKESTRRIIRHNKEGVVPYQYQFPVYVQPRRHR